MLVEVLHDRLTPKLVCLGSRDLFKFLEITDYISETMEDGHVCSGRLIGNCTWPIEWYHYQLLSMTLKVTFAVWNLSDSRSSGNVVCGPPLSTICLHMKPKAHFACNFNSSNMKDFSRSHTVTYTVNVVGICSRKRCKMESLDGPLIGSYIWRMK